MGGYKMLNFSNIADEVLKTSGIKLFQGKKKFSTITIFDRLDTSASNEGVYSFGESDTTTYDVALQNNNQFKSYHGDKNQPNVLLHLL